MRLCELSRFIVVVTDGYESFVDLPRQSNFANDRRRSHDIIVSVRAVTLAVPATLYKPTARRVIVHVPGNFRKYASK